LRFEVLGVPVDAVTMTEAIAHFHDRIRSRDQGYVVFCTVSTILEARRDPSLMSAIKDASLVTPDGMPLVWLGSRRGARIERVYGPDLMRNLMAACGPDIRHFFYGGTPEVLDKMIARLKAAYPDLVVAGAHAPHFGPLTPDTIRRDAALIGRAEPDVIWVGLGHPKQEMWMRESRVLLDAPMLAGVGAAFDFLAGVKTEAPLWLRKMGLQWLHRLLSEPRRLWRRYLVGNTVFVLLVLKERLMAALRGRVK
jgi:N-acetylglucosaminyldiphosphoundecaprenol N-acetyl-beta-D-mannosaminyltransferase